VPPLRGLAYWLDRFPGPHGPGYNVSALRACPSTSPRSRNAATQAPQGRHIGAHRMACGAIATLPRRNYVASEPQRGDTF